MDQKLLTNLLSLQFKLFHIPFYLYNDENRIASFEPYSTSCDLVKPWLEKLTSNEKSPIYILTKDSILFGRVHDNSDGFDIIIGPTRMGTISEKSLHNFISSGRPFISFTNINDIRNFFDSCSSYYLEQFLPIISSLHGFLNSNFISVDDMINRTIENSYLSDTQLRMIEATIEHTYDEKDRRNKFDIESKIMYYISNGMSNKLRKLNLDHNEIGSLSNDSLRHYKNALIILNTLSQRAAIIGGLDPEISYQLGEIYIQKIESCTDINSLIQINMNQNMTLDYCQRVELALYPQTNHAKINKAMHYIRENYQKRLTVDEIANIVDLSSEYLSTKFHQITGTTLPNYINQNKITEAKELLHFTDMSLLEISEYLSFSSQSYFQTIFKKITGLTPLEYRLKNKISSKNILNKGYE